MIQMRETSSSHKERVLAEYESTILAVKAVYDQATSRPQVIALSDMRIALYKHDDPIDGKQPKQFFSFNSNTLCSKVDGSIHTQISR